MQPYLVVTSVLHLLYVGVYIVVCCTSFVDRMYDTHVYIERTFKNVLGYNNVCRVIREHT